MQVNNNEKYLVNPIYRCVLPFKFIKKFSKTGSGINKTRFLKLYFFLV